VKLATYKPDRSAPFRLGLVSDDGQRVTPVLSDDGDALAEDVGALLALGARATDAVEKFQSAIRTGTATTDWLDLSEVVLGPPVLRPGKILAMGRNYYSHVREIQRANGDTTEPPPLPPAPMVFTKASSVLVGSGSPVKYPPLTSKLDYEVELTAVIGKPCYHVDASEAHDYVAGYTILNDLSMRDIQLAKAGDATLFGKNFPGAAPCGPFFISAQEFGDPGAKTIQTVVNGEVRQDSSTDEMIFPVRDIVAHCSRLGLEPGDLIATGTPAGVGLFQSDPAKLLHSGDQIRMRIEGIGELVTFIE